MADQKSKKTKPAPDEPFVIRITKPTPPTGPEKRGPSYARGQTLTTNSAELKHLGLPADCYERVDGSA